MMKMLRGVVSNTYKDRKFPGRFERGQEVDEEGEGEESEIDLLKNSKLWSKHGAADRVGMSKAKKDNQLSKDDLDALKGLSAEEQLKRLG